MIETKPVLLFASATTLTLVLNQAVQAEAGSAEAPQTPPSSASVPAPNPAPVTAPVAASAPPAQAKTDTLAPHQAETEAAPSAPPAQGTIQPSAGVPANQAAETRPPAAAEAAQPPAQAATVATPRERMEQRLADREAERNRRYEELRSRAAEMGLDLPQTPPWEPAGMQPPTMPTPPATGMPVGRRGGTTPEERDTQRELRYQMMRERAMQRGIELPATPPWKLMTDEERQAHREKVRNMTPEDRQAMRDQHWQEMRQRAKERGVEMPETPPWKQAEQRRKEMNARWEAYKETYDAMTAEQKEAVQALFGPGKRRLGQPKTGGQMPSGMLAPAPVGPQGYGMPPSNWTPGSGPRSANPHMFEATPGASWFGGERPEHSGPAAVWPGAGQGGLQGPPPPVPGADSSQP